MTSLSLNEFVVPVEEESDLSDGSSDEQDSPQAYQPSSSQTRHQSNSRKTSLSSSGKSVGNTMFGSIPTPISFSTSSNSPDTHLGQSHSRRSSMPVSMHGEFAVGSPSTSSSLANTSSASSPHQPLGSGLLHR